MSSEVTAGRASGWSQAAASLPVTVVMPVRNEVAFIERSLSSLLAQDYPMSQVEILVVDGMSEDGTRQTVEGFTRRFPFIRLLDNPGRIVPTALNIAIRAARGQWLIRLDAHSIYPPDYVRLCVETARRTGADNVGGVFITLPRDESRQALLVQAITTSRFGVGNAEYRLDVREGPADTVPYGCFRREIFTEIGLFDERLVRNQDYEFNRRLTRAGKRIWLNPAIQVKYYNQATLRGLLIQAFGTGKWNPWTWFVAPCAFAPRHVVPGLFVLGLLGVLGFTFLVPRGWLALVTIFTPYLVLALLASFQQSRRYGLGILLFLPPLFLVYHTSYGLGTLWGALRLFVGATPVQKIREPWPGAGKHRAWSRQGQGHLKG
jgi:glycosyltransferase involved in cell wall biosynthesis